MLKEPEENFGRLLKCPTKRHMTLGGKGGGAEIFPTQKIYRDTGFVSDLVALEFRWQT